MKPSPLAALMGSRKTMVGLFALALVAVVLICYQGTQAEKAGAVGTIALLAREIIAGIAKEDAAEKSRPPLPEDGVGEQIPVELEPPASGGAK